MRLRAVAVVIEDDHLLVIRRRKAGREYAVLPGGGVEDGESVTDACLRELAEETGLRGTLGELLPVPFEAEAPALYFSVRTGSSQPVLGGPERERSDAENVYEPVWVPLGQVAEVALVPEAAREAVGLAAPPSAERAEGGGGGPVVLREATAEDAEALWPLVCALATSYEPTWSGFRQGLDRILEDPGATVLVAADGDSLAGYVHVLVHSAFHADGAIGWVEELMVCEDRRGDGLGRALMEDAERWARTSADVAYIAVATRRAERFYAAIGYETSATYFKKAFR